MFKSISDYWNGDGDKAKEAASIEAESKKFKLPSEWLPEVVKYIAFAVLAFLNYRLFHETVPGYWGHFVGISAIISETLSLYCVHFFSRSSGAFRVVLGVVGGVLIAFALFHGTVSVMDMISNYDPGAGIKWYAHTVAFPLLFGLVTVGAIAIKLTHPLNLVRLRQAIEHTKIAISRAETASEIATIRNKSVVDDQKLKNRKEENDRDAQTIVEIRKLATNRNELRGVIMEIEDPELRAKLAADFGMTVPKLSAADQQSERSH